MASVLTMEKVSEYFTREGVTLSDDQVGKCFRAMENFYDEVVKASKKKSVGRGKTGYMMWLSENRSKLKEELGGGKVTEVAKLGGERWNALSEEDKLDWKERAIRDSGVGSVGKEKKGKWSFDLKSNEGDEVEYEGWSEANVGYFLEGKTDAGTKRGVGSFMRLSDAIDAGNDLGNGCGGIVKGNSGYTLKLSG